MGLTPSIFQGEDYAVAIQDFLDTCCKVQKTSSCGLDDFVLAFAFYLLHNIHLRRKLSGALNEPKSRDDNLFYYLPLWTRVADGCVKEHLVYRQRKGIHVLDAPSRRRVFGVEILQWPSHSIKKIHGNRILLDDDGVNLDYILKPIVWWCD
jgi:hypothetical protein